ncbi:MAG TPA: hypothetical protein VGP99_03255, partial [Tepidisphaeraceae bacterium]|nr:hypothetical protein [Tepidisphaeraceae bacterium]
MFRDSRLFALSCAVIILMVAQARAQTQSQTNNQLPPPVDRTASTEAKKKVQTAESEVNRAKTALAEVVAKLR